MTHQSSELIAHERLDEADLDGFDRGNIAFGYLGCREQVAPFYVSCGWARVFAREKSIGRDGEPVVGEPGQPILIRPVTPLAEWLEGDIDLRGRTW